MRGLALSFIQAVRFFVFFFFFFSFMQQHVVCERDD